MGRATSSLASTALAATLLSAPAAACNALTGASDLVPCADCELDDAPSRDASGDTGRVGADASNAPEGGDGTAPSDAPIDAPSDVDAGVDSAIGCQGAVDCTRVVFASSQGFMGSLGGTLGADAKCQALADLSINPLIKGRTFQAWVSTSATPVSARFAHGSQPYVLGNGTVVATDWNDLVKGSLRAAIDVDELGATRSTSAWTATTSSGANYAGPDCTEWMVGAVGTKGVYGNVGGTGSGWSSNTTMDCTNANALYCFEK